MSGREQQLSFQSERRCVLGVLSDSLKRVKWKKDENGKEEGKGKEHGNMSLRGLGQECTGDVMERVPMFEMHCTA